MHVPDVDTTGGPPLRLPLAHVVIALGFLLAGSGLGLLAVTGRLHGIARLAPLHLLVLGWVCVTIMGAMEQFVPVWSGVDLHSRRLADLALVLVTAGVVGIASAALFGHPRLLAFGLLAVVGLWVFVYTLLRTLPLGDVTERHFAYALSALAVAAGLGGLLALDFSVRLLSRVGLAHDAVRASHATLALLGGVLLTVVGALVRLGPMFVGNGDLDATGRRLVRAEEATLPLGVVGLSVGRALALGSVARVGALFVLVGTCCLVGVLVRAFHTGRTEPTPTSTRYAVVAAALALWVVLAGPALLTTPLETGIVGPAPAAWTFGLALAAVLVGTLYHVVPFLVWDHRYADRLGYEPVPTVEDLYDARVARADFLGLALGGVALVAGAALGRHEVVVAGALLACAAFALAALNLVGVVWQHAAREWSPGPHPDADVRE